MKLVSQNKPKLFREREEEYLKDDVKPLYVRATQKKFLSVC